MTNAARVAAELKEAFDVEAKLVPGFLGVFDVHVNGEIVFSKSEEGDRFPKPGEIEQEILRRFYFDSLAKKWIRRREVSIPR